MKNPKLLSRDDLEKLANRLIDILYFEADTNKMNPDKEWEVDFIEYIDAEMERLGLKPEFDGDNCAA